MTGDDDRVVWVRYLSSYAPGGHPDAVFSSAETAKMSLPHVKDWDLEADGSWAEAHRPGTTHDQWVIEPFTVDADHEGDHG
jgi:hypothetical protein